MPPIDGNHAVTAVAAPNNTSATMPSTCSRINIISAITPIARNPGISRTVCSQPMSDPSNWPTSITKLFSRADQTENAKGMAMAIATNSALGLRHAGKLWDCSIGKICMCDEPLWPRATISFNSYAETCQSSKETLRININRQTQIATQFNIGRPIVQSTLQRGRFVRLDQQAHAIASAHPCNRGRRRAKDLRINLIQWGAVARQMLAQTKNLFCVRPA